MNEPFLEKKLHQKKVRCVGCNKFIHIDDWFGTDKKGFYHRKCWEIEEVIGK